MNCLHQQGGRCAGPCFGCCCRLFCPRFSFLWRSTLPRNVGPPQAIGRVPSTVRPYTSRCRISGMVDRPSHLPAPQILRVRKLYCKVASARLHFARSTRTISAEGGAGAGQIALSPASRALDTHDLRRGLRAHGTNRALACVSRTRHARSPQRVAAISAEGCASSLQNERFVRDCLKTHTPKSAKRAFRTRLPQKSSGNTHRSTHITQPCQAVSRLQPFQTTSAHTAIPM